MVLSLAMAVDATAGSSNRWSMASLWSALPSSSKSAATTMRFPSSGCQCLLQSISLPRTRRQQQRRPLLASSFTALSPPSSSSLGFSGNFYTARSLFTHYLFVLIRFDYNLFILGIYFCLIIIIIIISFIWAPDRLPNCNYALILLLLLLFAKTIRIYLFPIVFIIY